MQDMAGFPGSPGGAALIAEKIFDAAADSWTFSGLDGNADGWYELEIETKNDGASAAGYSLYVNGNTTAANYYTQYHSANSTTLGGARFSGNEVTWGSAGKTSLAHAKCTRLPDGTFAFNSTAVKDATGASSVNMQAYAVSSTFTITNITSLTITAAVANGLGVGTKIRLLKGKH